MIPVFSSSGASCRSSIEQFPFRGCIIPRSIYSTPAALCWTLLIAWHWEPWTLDSRSRWPAILLEVFLYGIYVVLFSSCTFILWQRKSLQKTLFITSCILFFLASTDVVVTVYFFFRFVIQNGSLTNSSHSGNADPDEETWNPVLEVKFAVYVVANLVNSSILIHRCHTLWQDWRITVAPVVLIVSGTVISFASLGATQVGDKLLAASFITSAAGNLSVTFLIVTGMLWTSRKIRSVLRMDIPMAAGYAMSLLIDSGAFYSISIFLYLVFHSVVISASLTQVGCITTTAISLLSSHTSEPLGIDNTAFIASNATRPEIRSPDPVYSRHQRSGDSISHRSLPAEQNDNDDQQSVDLQYK